MRKRKPTKKQKRLEAAMKRDNQLTGEIVLLTAFLTAPLWLPPGVWAAIRKREKRKAEPPKLEISNGMVIDAESVVIS